MAIQCCGKDVDFKFCPLCGKDCSEGGDLLFELLKHCRLMGRTMHTRSLRLEEQIARNSRGVVNSGLTYSQKKLESFKASTAKWQGWADRLEEVIKAQGGTT